MRHCVAQEGRPAHQTDPALDPGCWEAESLVDVAGAVAGPEDQLAHGQGTRRSRRGGFLGRLDACQIERSKDIKVTYKCVSSESPPPRIGGSRARPEWLAEGLGSSVEPMPVRPASLPGRFPRLRPCCSANVSIQS